MTPAIRSRRHAPLPVGQQAQGCGRPGVPMPSGRPPTAAPTDRAVPMGAERAGFVTVSPPEASLATYVASCVVGLALMGLPGCAGAPEPPATREFSAGVSPETPPQTHAQTKAPAPTGNSASAVAPADAQATTRNTVSTRAQPSTESPAVPDEPVTITKLVAFESLRPFYDASVHEQSLFVLIPGTGAAWVGRNVKDDEELPRGHRLEPKRLKTLGTLHVVSTSGAQALSSYEGFTGLLPEEYGSVRYDGAGVCAEPLVMKGEPAPSAKVRPISAPAVPASGKDPLSQRAKRLVVKTYPPERQPWAARRLTKFAKQEVEGNFAGEPRLVVVFVWAHVDLDLGQAEADAGLYGSAIFTLDDAGKVVRQTVPEMEVTAKVLVDLDGDGNDEILTADQGYEESGRSLYRVTAKRIQHMEIFHVAI